MTEAVDFEPRPLELARKCHALLEVSIRIRGSIRPELSYADVDQGDRAQVVKSKIWRVRSPGRGEQPLCLVNNGGKIATTTGQGEAQERQGDLESSAPVLRHRPQAAAGAQQVDFPFLD